VGMRRGSLLSRDGRGQCRKRLKTSRIGESEGKGAAEGSMILSEGTYKGGINLRTVARSLNSDPRVKERRSIQN